MARPRKQTQIPGTEHKGVPELDEIAVPYAEKLYERMELQREEVNLKAQLLDRMRRLGRDEYRYTDGEYVYEFHVEPSCKLKAKRRRMGDDDSAAGGPDPDESESLLDS